MTTGILGRKVGMTQIYSEAGEVISVTVIAAGPCQVLQIRTHERDGYDAVQLGYLDKPRRLARRSERGHVAKLSSKRAKKLGAAGIQAPPKAGCEPKRFIRELRGPAAGHEVGQEVRVDIFQPTYADLPRLLEELAKQKKVDTEKAGWQAELARNDKTKNEYREILASLKKVDVTGTSKGRGFAGVIKRHNFSGQRATHGVKKVHRHAGGTGCSADPSRLFKGRRMAGQHGSERVTVRNLKVIRIDPENNLLLVGGAVPGPNGGMLMIRETNKVG